jgi:hypothetical protein
MIGFNMNRYSPGDILLSNDLYQTVTIMAIAEILIGKNYQDIVYIFEEGGYESCKIFDSAPYKVVAIKDFYVEKELPVHPVSSINFNSQHETIIKCIDQNYGFMPDMLKIPDKLDENTGRFTYEINLPKKKSFIIKLRNFIFGKPPSYSDFW